MTNIISNLIPTPLPYPDATSVEKLPPLTPDLLPTDQQTDLQTLPLALQHSEANTSVNYPLDDAITQKTLDPSAFSVDWVDIFDEATLKRFTHQGFVVLDDIFSKTALLALQAESGFVAYRDAKIAEGLRLADIRGDKIRWITKDFFAGYYYLQSINELAQLFNRWLFVGIRHSEAHYACYPPGFGYQWHSDNPIGRDERAISAVYYLNDDWIPKDGGALVMIDTLGHEHRLLPKANRLVVFDSNLRHQVEIAHRQRYSIATWMRRDDPMGFTI